MERSIIDLSKYRLDTSKSDLNVANMLFDAKEFRASVNRSYYSVFHALRAVIALDGFDSSKHSGIIAYFNEHYVKTGVFEKIISKCISTTYKIRENLIIKIFMLCQRRKRQFRLKRQSRLLLR